MLSDLPDLDRIGALLDAGARDEARAALESALEAGAQTDQREERRLAELAERAGLLGAAETAWRSVLVREPEDEEVLGRLATLSRASGRLEEALGWLERLEVLARDPDGWIQERIEVLLELGRWQDVEKELDSLQRTRQPDDPLLGSLRELVSGGEGDWPGDRGRDETEAREPESSHAPAPSLRDQEPRSAPRSDGPTREVSRPPVPTDDDVVRFQHRFAGREDVHARMWCDEDGNAGYAPVREPMTFQHVRNHLLGNVTLGVYPIRLDGTVGFFALDLDISKPALEAARADPEKAKILRERVRSEGLRLYEALRDVGLNPLFESSGFKGRHLWVFVDPPQPASRIHALGKILVAGLEPRTPDLHVEFFPKQARTRGGLGNLIKLPLGIHRKTGRFSLLLDQAGQPHPDPHGLLRNTPIADESTLKVAEARFRELGPVDTSGGQSTSVAGGPVVAEGLEAMSAAQARPKPPSTRAPWTEADFERHPQVSHLLERCSVLSAITEKVLQTREVTPDEVQVLRSTFGHFPAGVEAANHLFSVCGTVPPEGYLKSPLKGNPSSCAKIRKRVPATVEQARCPCDVDTEGALYPTPLLHLRTAPAPDPDAALPGDPAGRSPADLARVLGDLEWRQEQIERQIGQIRETLLEWLTQNATSRIDLEEGAYLVEEKEGVRSLRWAPGGNDEPDRTEGREPDEKKSEQEEG